MAAELAAVGAPTSGAQAPDAPTGEAAGARAAAPDPHVQKQLAEAPVRIELDRAVVGGVVDDRFDILIRGRVVSAEPIVAVRLRAGGQVFSAAFYAHAQQPADAGTAEKTGARPISFQFNLPAPGEKTEGQNAPGQNTDSRCEFQIAALTEAGNEHVEAYTLDFDPGAQRVAFGSGPTTDSLGIEKPDVIVYIEHAMLDPDGILSVSGWAVAMEPVLTLQVQADGEAIGTARGGYERGDVSAAYPSFPNGGRSGFSFVSTLDPLDFSAAFVGVQAVCGSGRGQEVLVPIHRTTRRIREAATPALPPAPMPEPVSQGRPAEAPAPVFNLLNQKPSYSLRSEFRIADEPLVGLVLTTPATRAVAGHAPAAGSGTPSAEIRMFCDTVRLASDGVLSASGWAVCGIGIAQVRVLLDSEPVGLAAYGHERSDVGAAFPEIAHATLSGFRFQQRIADHVEGEHSVRIIVRNLAGAEKEAIIETAVTVAPAHPAPATVTVPDPAPATAPAAPVVAAPAADAPVATQEQSDEFKFELDAPKLVNGAVPELITGRLTVDGWLLSRSGVDSFEVFLDEQKLGDMHYGLARQDVGTAFPEWPNSLRSGFAFHCPPRGLKNGAHTMRLVVRAKSGATIDRTFQLTVKKSEENEDQGGFRRQVPRVEADMILALLDTLGYRPHLRFVMRQAEQMDLDALGRTLDALRLLAWDDWSVLMLASDVRVGAALSILVDETIPDLADRFEIVSAENETVCDVPLATGSAGRNTLYLPLLAGDEPGADAGLELAAALARHPEANIAYGDELRLSPVSREREAFFKPDFSPDLLTATHYFGRLWAVTDAVLARTGATPRSLLAQGEYDLALHCAEHAGGIRHVAKLLCQRGAAAGDTPEQEQAALERMAQRRGLDATVERTSIPGTWRLKRAVQTKGLVSIIIPTCGAHGYIKTCLNTLRARTRYETYETIVIDNIPASDTASKDWVRQNADKVVEIPDAFNWSIFNNRAAAEASGEFLLFLNDDITITDADWLDALLEHAQRPEVGIVGPQLLYPDGKVQHAGMFLANNGIGRHAFRFAMHDDPCYFGLALTQRNVMAVTGACMLVRKAVFDTLGRFDEAHQIVNNDLDFCLRVHQAGLLTVYTPYASMTHHELASRAYMKDVFDLTQFNAQWKTTFAAGDPYFSPRLWRHADDYRPDDEAVELVVSGSPLFHKQEIKRILVVKLDHIGDFVTALPPIRRLKAQFPEAHITVLAGPASRAFVALEPAIDSFIPFAFFHARSQLGERELTAEDYKELAEQLRPHRFDLAVDLRKHPSTRDVLKYSGARFLAGFDYQGQYPNLDIALDWDGDRTLQRKRSHIVDDLMALVNAVGHAAEPDRTVITPPEPMAVADMPPEVAALFCKPVVAVHTGAGNITKQWPEAHFAALIDLLIERNGVNVMLVGGPDEREIADTVMSHVLHAGSVASMVGKTPLAALPGLLRTCALYIGNDSGPKHIAAAVGIPTIGIHSGVVDPVEWGPIGPNAVALRRNMSCSPCYLAKAEDCPRGLACLTALEPNHAYETADLLLARGRVRPVAETVVTPPRKAGRRGSGRKAQPQTAETA